MNEMFLEEIKKGYDFFRSNNGDLRKMIDGSKPKQYAEFGFHDNDTYEETEKTVSHAIGAYLKEFINICEYIKGVEMLRKSRYKQNWMRVATGSIKHPEYENWRKYVEDYRKNNSEDKWGIDYKVGDKILTNLENGFNGGTILEISNNIMKIELNPVDKRRKKKEILTRIVEPRIFPNKSFSDI